MLGAEKPTKQQGRARPGTTAGTRRDEQPGAQSPGRLVARRGVDAVNSTEARICGSAAVHAPSVAEGLALAGRRAATLLAYAEAPRVHIAGDAPWVHHRVRTVPGEALSGAAFELVAGTAQEAVDHCLVAHRLAQDLGRPGVCSIDRSLADGIHLLRLPEDRLLSSLLAEVSPAGADAVTDGLADADVLRSATEALEAVSGLTGRPVTSLIAEGPIDSGHVLLGSGAAGRLARALARRLTDDGQACGSVAISLVRPFPQRELSQALETARKVVVLDAREAPGGPRLLSAVRRALGDTGADVEVVVVDNENASEVRRSIVTAFGWSQETAAPARPSEATESPAFTIGVRPATAWSEQLLLDTAARLGALGDWRLVRPRRDSAAVSVLTLAPAPGDAPDSKDLDLLFAAHVDVLDVERSIAAVRTGGVVVIDAHVDSPEALWMSLGPARREQILRRRLTLGWIDSSARITGNETTPETIAVRIQGALLNANGALSRVAGLTEPVVAALTSAGVEPRDEMDALAEGAAALRIFDPSTIKDVRSQGEADFRRSSESLPRMPDVGNGEPEAGWNDAVREFHRTGRGAFSEFDPLPALPLIPAALDAVTRDGGARRDFPWVVPTDAGGLQGSLAGLIAGALDAMEAVGTSAPLVRANVAGLVATAARLLRGRREGAPLGTFVDATLETFASELDVSEAGAGAVRAELSGLRGHLPREGTVLALDHHTLLGMCTATIRHAKRQRSAEFRKDAAKLILSLRELLLLDDARDEGGTSPERIASTLPDVEHLPLDPAALSRNLPRHRGSKRLAESRRRRIERAVGVLQRYLDDVDRTPEMVVVHAEDTPLGKPEARLHFVGHADAMEAAVGLFDGLADRTAEVVRAVRLARLEARGEYDPRHHDPILERFDREALNADELMLVPAVLVVETAQRLQGRALAAFSELLRSGRPVQVVVVDQATASGAGEAWETLAGYHPGLGYVAVAHREALVIQSTLGDPDHLTRGLQRMATAPVPSVAFVAIPSWESVVSPRVQLDAARHGRATPCFVYDAGAGATWAERFDLSGNPQPESPWPVQAVEYVAPDGEQGVLDEAFTYAHAVATDPAYRGQFRVVPTVSWGAGQLELAAWLEAGEAERRRTVPFVWVVRDEGSLARAVVTRELAFACRDRRRAWRILQELAGTDNEYAHRAAEAARQQALVEAERSRDELEAAHAEELARVRAEAGSEAVDRIVAVLMNAEALPAVGGTPAAGAVAPAPAPTQPVVEPTVEETAVEQEPEEEEEDLGFDEPFITSALCTTCQECININPRMFQYNENKQATIADASAGNYEQLVKAAEKCPARCIHPGVPRDGDATATAEMLERGKRFR